MDQKSWVIIALAIVLLLVLIFPMQERKTTITVKLPRQHHSKASEGYLWQPDIGQYGHEEGYTGPF